MYSQSGCEGEYTQSVRATINVADGLVGEVVEAASSSRATDVPNLNSEDIELFTFVT